MRPDVFVYVHLKFSDAKALAVGTDSPARAAYQCFNEHCICKAARTCACLCVRLKGDFCSLADEVSEVS